MEQRRALSFEAGAQLDLANTEEHKRLAMAQRIHTVRLSTTAARSNKSNGAARVDTVPTFRSDSIAHERAKQTE